MPSEGITRFAEVDRTRDPQFFPRFLDASNKLPAIAASKRMVLDALVVHEGDHVLDVGCGAGEDVIELSALAGTTGVVTGVDASATMIEEAKRRAAARRVPAHFEVGDSQALPFPSGAFDAVRTHRVLMHVTDAERAIAEMSRVLKPGGRLAAFDFDHDTMFCDSPYKETTRKIARSFCDGLKSGSIGSRLPRLFGDSGMTDISVKCTTALIHYEFAELLLGGHVAQMHAAGELSAEEADAWWTALASASRAGVFTCGFTGFVVSGVKR